MPGSYAYNMHEACERIQRAKKNKLARKAVKEMVIRDGHYEPHMLTLRDVNRVERNAKEALSNQRSTILRWLNDVCYNDDSSIDLHWVIRQLETGTLIDHYSGHYLEGWDYAFTDDDELLEAYMEHGV